MFKYRKSKAYTRAHICDVASSVVSSGYLGNI